MIEFSKLTIKSVNINSGMNMRKIFAITAVCFLLSACQTNPAVNVVQQPQLNSAPDLSRYVRFELFSQAAVATGELQSNGFVQFSPTASHLTLLSPSRAPLGVLHIQADQCRDDPSPMCLRRFSAVGMVTALGSSLSCSIPIRNDASIGYAGQTLVGICQSQFGRIFTLQINGD